jgi:hypothetical protein
MDDIKRLEAIYRVTGRELRHLLLSSSVRSSVGSGAVQVRVRNMVSDLNRAVDQWASPAIDLAYARGSAKARTALEILGRRPQRGMTIDRPRMLHDDLMLTLIKANNSIPSIVERFLAAEQVAGRAELEFDMSRAQVQEFSYTEAEDHIQRIARNAVKQDASRQKLTKRIKDYLQDLIGDDDFIEIGGRMYRMTAYAEMVGRTVLREAQSKATLDLCEQYDNDLVQVSDHGTICEECKEYEGNIYSISGTNPDYPALEAEPPYHPNCEHSLLPTSEIAIRSEKEYGLYQEE